MYAAYDHMQGNLPAKNTVFTPYIVYTYVCMVLASPKHNKYVINCKERNRQDRGTLTDAASFLS
jgi:hypothetical protein